MKVKLECGTFNYEDILDCFMTEGESADSLVFYLKMNNKKKMKISEEDYRTILQAMDKHLLENKDEVPAGAIEEMGDKQEIAPYGRELEMDHPDGGISTLGLVTYDESAHLMSIGPPQGEHLNKAVELNALGEAKGPGTIYRNDDGSYLYSTDAILERALSKLGE